MSDEMLRLAARSLRDTEGDATPGEGPAPRWQAMDGWSGILRDVRRARRRRRTAFVAALQIVLALAGLGAWAAASGRLPAFLSLASPSAPPPSATRSARARRPLVPTVAVATPELPESAALEPSPPAPTNPAPQRQRPARSLSVRSTVAPSLAGLPAAELDLLYREAHAAHFVRKDYPAALAAWDRYLAAGAGPLALEARYNRAIVLVRLGRRDEAASALEPFAAGDYGGYRLAEARALLSMLRAPP